MVLSGSTISARGLIVGGAPSSFRDGSYDLTIGDLVTSEGGVVQEFLLPAQGIVKVISAEEVKVPADIIGYVLVKTKLCNEGVLALNIGIVDPGFEGPLQSALINFGKTDIRLHAGDVFGRISFHTLDTPRTAPPPPANAKEAVRREVKRQVDQFLPSTFLDIPKTAEKAAEKIFADYKSSMLKWLPAVALLIAGMTFALNFGNMWLLYAYMKPQDQVRTEQLWRDATERIKKLEDENAKLRQAPAPGSQGAPQGPSRASGPSRGKP